jgi:hypothetical protein
MDVIRDPTYLPYGASRQMSPTQIVPMPTAAVPVNSIPMASIPMTGTDYCCIMGYCCIHAGGGGDPQM